MDWAKLASMAAFIVSCIYILEWMWKRILRPFSERRGWVKVRMRRPTDSKPGDFDPLERINKMHRD